MSTFKKSGHWRKSIYGVKHWVQEHVVEREDFSRIVSSQSAPALLGAQVSQTERFRQDLAAYRAGGSAASFLYIPNSRCPVCQADVFFYRNNQGSRVYFDDLGPPWPKHPCTDVSSNGLTTAECDVIQPGLRDESDLPYIANWLRLAKVDLDSDHKDRYGFAPWDLWRVDLRVSRPHATFMALSKFSLQSTDRLFVRARRLPKSLAVGQTVFFDKGRISFFNLDALAPTQIEVRVIRGAATFVNQLIGD
ncbi:MAG: hypothetical protein ACOYMN_16700 [Roseimicrobium sp.]